MTGSPAGHPHGTEAPHVRALNVHKRFSHESGDVEVLRGVSFELQRGSAVSIVGPSGSGKSTLLHVLGGMDPPSAGTLEISGSDPYALRDPELARFRNRSVGFVFQEAHLLPQYTALENVLLPTLADGSRRSRHGREPWARELLDRVGLGSRLLHRPAELSGGERQRTALARALVNRPGLLLCDEPTGSLDRAAAAVVVDLLLELHRELGATLVVVTHDTELAARFDRWAGLVEGRWSER